MGGAGGCPSSGNLAAVPLWFGKLRLFPFPGAELPGAAGAKGEPAGRWRTRRWFCDISSFSVTSDGTVPVTKEDGKLENGRSPVSAPSALGCDDAERAYRVLLPPPGPDLMDGSGTGTGTGKSAPPPPPFGTSHFRMGPPPPFHHMTG